jgi:hypothetical protein
VLLLSVAALALVAVFLLAVLRRSKTRHDDATSSPSSRLDASWFVAHDYAALDVLCAHVSLLVIRAKDAGSTRVTIDVRGVTALDRSSLTLLMASQEHLARHGLRLELVRCSDLVARQLLEAGLRKLMSGRVGAPPSEDRRGGRSLLH